MAILATTAAAQDDIAPYRLTDVSGDFSVRYLLDEWVDTSPGSESRSTAPTWIEELWIRSRSYIYHPAMLQMDISGGPMLVQYGYESELGSIDGSDTFYNLDVALNFLSRRAFPFTVFYRRDHPEINTGLSGRFLATSKEYGVKGTLRPPLTPMQVLWEVSHWESLGSGIGTLIDENVDRAKLRTFLPYGDNSDLKLTANWNRRESRSGSPGLPIQTSEITTTTASLDGNNTFGSSRPARLRHTVSWLQQETGLETAFEERLMAYKGDLKWAASEATLFFGNLNFRDSDRNLSWSRTGNFAAGINHELKEDFIISGEGGLSTDDAPGFSRDMTRGRISANYQRPISFGSLGSSASLSLSRIDQDADVDTVRVIDEPHVLAGTVPVTLSRDFVVTATVVVTNDARTQTFIEGLDYRLVTVGAATTIERILTGNILDGQTVLVSYDVLAGGTVEFDTQSQALAVNLGLFKWGNIYVQFRDQDNKIRSGNPTTPLNDNTRIEMGGRADFPLAAGWSLGANFRYVDQNEDISPYEGKYIGAYIQSGRYLNSVVRLGLQRNTVDNESSPEDVNLLSYTFGLTSRLPGGVVLAYDAEYREDDGGTIFREDWRHSVRLDWSYRQVRFTMRADQSDITQGDHGRKTTRVFAELRRRF